MVLEEEARRRKFRRVQEAAVKLEIFAKIPDEEIIESVKRVRTGR